MDAYTQSIMASRWELALSRLERQRAEQDDREALAGLQELFQMALEAHNGITPSGIRAPISMESIGVYKRMLRIIIEKDSSCANTLSFLQGHLDTTTTIMEGGTSPSLETLQSLKKFVSGWRAFHDNLVRG